MLISRLPKGVLSGTDKSARQSATKKMIWTVDGAQRVGYTIALMKKILDVDKVQDIKDAMKWDGNNMLDGKLHEFTIVGNDSVERHCTFQVAGTLTPTEVAASVEDDDDNDDENGDD